MRPVRAVEVDAGGALVFVDERAAFGQLALGAERRDADLVVAVDARAGDEVVGVGDPPRLLRLDEIAVATRLEVVERTPVRTTGSAIRHGQHAADRRAVRLEAAVVDLADVVDAAGG